MKDSEEQNHRNNREHSQEPQCLYHSPATVIGGSTAIGGSNAIGGSTAIAGSTGHVEKGDRGGCPHHRQDGDSVVPRGRLEPEVRVHNETEGLQAVRQNIT